MTTKTLSFKSLPQLAIAEGATTPNPGIAGVWVWSTTLSKPVIWTGSLWTAANLGAATGGGITYTRRLGNYLAVNNDGIIADTSGGSFTITLPTTPSTGDQVHIVDGANWSTNNLTVARNGSTIESLAEDLVLDIGGLAVSFIYNSATWQVYTEAGAGVIQNIATTDTQQTLTNKTVQGLLQTRVAMPANNIDLSAGDCFTKTITADTTFTVTNTPSSGKMSSFILELTNAGAFIITWWAGLKWSYGVQPQLTTTGRDILAFYTHDGGTTWNALLLAKDIK